ncbi:hypothetical protein Naga_100533g8 [Nannochloropsis gaditana]|uniref:Uncharacterized protein n=1 Tax=Nannochloropsis gaditana TaxID=72520 RepID=W7T9P9_9STRA|nr:hypothetical protein Naga_100533g8 [Nannochloropsis gaditana]
MGTETLLQAITELKGEMERKFSSLYSTGNRKNTIKAMEKQIPIAPDKSHEMLQAIAELKGAVESNSKKMEEIKNRPSRNEGPQSSKGEHTRPYRYNHRPPAEGPRHFPQRNVE